MERINHFILMCKGWYIPNKHFDSVLDIGLSALKLDGYEFATKQDVIPLVLNVLDDLICAKVIDFRITLWNQMLSKYMYQYNFDYESAVLMSIKEIFAYGLKNCKLTPPIYSRKLFKMGLVAPKYFGTTYKMQNEYVKNNFNIN